MRKLEYNEMVHQLFIAFQKAYYSARREALYNILIESEISMKLVRLIKRCLNETHSKVHMGKHFSVKNGVFWNVTLCGPCKNRRFGGT
jgi:hypothetical protein